MVLSSAKLMARLLPTGFLPKGHKSVNGVRVELNIQERREFLERKIAHQIGRFLDRYSPVRRAKKLWRRRRLERQKTELFVLIGKIALVHAGIEKGLKAALVGDWDVPEKFEETKLDNNGNSTLGKDGQPAVRTVSIDKLFGDRLKKRFFREVGKRLIPSDFKIRYQVLYAEFDIISQQRNNVLKAEYSFNEDTANVSQVHEIRVHTWRPLETSYEEFVQSWLPPVDLHDLQALHDSLIALSGSFRTLRTEIFKCKLELFSKLCSEPGKTYPTWARKNPHLYESTVTDTE